MRERFDAIVIGAGQAGHVMCAKKPYTTIQRAVHIHPTVTELIPTLLGGLAPLSDPGARTG